MEDFRGRVFDRKPRRLTGERFIFGWNCIRCECGIVVGACLDRIVHDVVAERMGIRSARISLGQPKYVPLVEAAAPAYERWIERWIKEGDLATSFAYFLSTESGSILIPQGIRHIAAVLPSFSNSEWRRERLTDALSAAVRTCWKKYSDQVRSDPDFWKAFLTVLNALCARQDAIALSIQLEMARSSV